MCAFSSDTSGDIYRKRLRRMHRLLSSQPKGVYDCSPANRIRCARTVITHDWSSAEHQISGLHRSSGQRKRSRAMQRAVFQSAWAYELVALLDGIGQRKATVVEHNDRITGYATSIGFLGHAGGESNEDLKSLMARPQKFRPRASSYRRATAIFFAGVYTTARAWSNQ